MGGEEIKDEVMPFPRVLARNETQKLCQEFEIAETILYANHFLQIVMYIYLVIR